MPALPPCSSSGQFDTYLSTRLVKHALELKKPTMLLNVGPTRADGLPGVEKIDVPSGAVMRQVAKEVMLVLGYPHFQ